MNKLSSSFPHAIVLLVSLALIFGGLAFNVSEQGFCVWASTGERSPTSCAFRFFTGIDCPGCGMTRCFVSMVHGQWAQAWRFHPWGVVFYLFLCAQIPYRLFQIYRISTNREPIVIPYWTEGLVGFLLLYFIQWFFRLGHLI